MVKSFSGGPPVIDRLTMHMAPGDIYGFIGANGAGKSTTMRVIVGVLSADAGSIQINGQAASPDIRRQIGYMPEERGLYPKMKVAEQLRYFARLHGADTERASSITDYWIHRLGLSDQRDAQLGSLSLGNQQRVQLAAALVHSPQLLLLDEPFSGLDPVAVDVMGEILTDQAGQGIPVLFSSHQLDLVQRLCNRVGVLAGGRIRAEGAVGELRAGGSLQVEIEAEAPPGWADHLPEITKSEYTGPRTVLTLRPDADPQNILAAALTLGPVHYFRKKQPDLIELFRDIVEAASRNE
ncbi:ATP-binding cassette domain-containing protein [Tsukamurella paurometabola]|uniref:ATP-binding cassette domain-containing protein n=2 Tax=Tsukamurella paurometabola TaxID=2061 RepID=A0ABS5NIU9_TSUPA|nr:ATP-binding cassette domain-containing protein [Tsukamurella paurometabola]